MAIAGRGTQWLRDGLKLIKSTKELGDAVEREGEKKEYIYI